MLINIYDNYFLFIYHHVESQLGNFIGLQLIKFESQNKYNFLKGQNKQDQITPFISLHPSYNYTSKFFTGAY